MQKYLGSGLFLLGFLITPSLFASAAKILFTKNEVLAQGKSGEHKLARGSSVDVGDTVITKAKSQTNFKYANGTLINLGENSNYKILAYSQNKVDAQINQGKLSLKTTKQIKEEISTPVVTLSILGTSAQLYVTPTATHVKVTEGLVQAKSGSLKPGDSAVFNRNGMTYAPFPKEGVINTPPGAPGAISSGGTTSSTGIITTNLDTTILLATVSTGTGAAAASTSTGIPVVPPPITIAEIGIIGCSQ